jgi:hypothetical protein
MKEKFFKPVDIILYTSLLFFIAAFVLFFIFSADRGELLGIEIYHGSVLVYRYVFSGESKIFSESVSEEINESTVTVAISLNGKENTLTIDIENKSVKMLRANCPGRDCTAPLMQINKPRQAIICAAHAIKVTGLGKGSITIPVG